MVLGAPHRARSHLLWLVAPRWPHTRLATASQVVQPNRATALAHSLRVTHSRHAHTAHTHTHSCLLYTSDAADDM
eukprot:1536638-Prymnesium_polylepis.1